MRWIEAVRDDWLEHKCAGTDRTERRVRELAEQAVRCWPRADVNLPWSQPVRFTSPGERLPVEAAVHVLRVYVPGDDFAARLAVEKQIRAQLP